MIEKYDAVCAYLYPQVQKFARSHGMLRDKMLDTLLRIPGEIYLAAKVSQISKLNILDSSLAELRWQLRFSASPGNRLITRKQQSVAERLIFEVGIMVNAWKNKLR